MSFIVKGIDLPKECRAVEITFYIPNIIHSDNIYINGRELLDQEISALFTAEHLNDIIQIPNPHGRLIDENELKSKVHDVILEGGVKHGCIDKTVLHECRTILEAESEEKK